MNIAYLIIILTALLTGLITYDELVTNEVVKGVSTPLAPSQLDLMLK